LEEAKMKGDFSRVTFDSRKHFSRVLEQQGRVRLDADDNERDSILLHYLRTLVRDLLGPYAAPVEEGGFKLRLDSDGLHIGPGRMYIDGILVESERECLYTAQPDCPLLPDDALLDATRQGRSDRRAVWVYLDVWERHITALEDDSIREPALEGSDSCTRAKVVWQVKTVALDPAPVAGDDGSGCHAAGRCAEPLGGLVCISCARLEARMMAHLPTQGAEVVPSPTPPFSGAENHLYRVEIHEAGAKGSTFKWSRNNGSVATRWVGGAGTTLQVADARGFAEGNWVELSDDSFELTCRPGVLVRIVSVEGVSITLDPATPAPPWSQDLLNPTGRRWDQSGTGGIVLRNGAVAVRETPADGARDQAAWTELEDGLQVRFAAGGDYRTGDYWLIPARRATGTIEWPDSGAVRPHGVEHHYAPLGIVSWRGDEVTVRSCRREFEPLASGASGAADGVPQTAGRARRTR
jgi:hypothetical protein